MYHILRGHPVQAFHVTALLFVGREAWLLDYGDQPFQGKEITKLEAFELMNRPEVVAWTTHRITPREARYVGELSEYLVGHRVRWSDALRMLLGLPAVYMTCASFCDMVLEPRYPRAFCDTPDQLLQELEKYGEVHRS